MPGSPPAPPPAPTAPERVLSVLAAADSLDVVCAAGRTRLVGAPTVDAGGQLAVRLPAAGCLARAAAHARGGELPITVEITDVAAVAMRRRVRAQVTLHARLVVVGHRADRDPGPAEAEIRPSCAQLIEDASYTFISGPALSRAVPDPLAAHEAALLLHLTDVHRDVLDLLTRQVPVRLLHGVRAVHALRLDRFGIVLRLEHARADHDVRLPFPTPLHHRAQAPEQIHALLRRALTCHRRRSTH